jgi:hypothetical protein
MYGAVYDVPTTVTVEIPVNLLADLILAVEYGQGFADDFRATGSDHPDWNAFHYLAGEMLAIQERAKTVLKEALEKSGYQLAE